MVQPTTECCLDRYETYSGATRCQRIQEIVDARSSVQHLEECAVVRDHSDPNHAGLRRKCRPTTDIIDLRHQLKGEQSYTPPRQTTTGVAFKVLETIETPTASLLEVQGTQSCLQGDQNPDTTQNRHQDARAGVLLAQATTRSAQTFRLLPSCTARLAPYGIQAIGLQARVSTSFIMDILLAHQCSI
jgi:hypothetical protein